MTGDTGSFTCNLPNDIFKGTFKFSSVMMRLNWSLTRIHTAKLIDCKYAIHYAKSNMQTHFLVFWSTYRNLLEYQGTRNSWPNCYIQLSKSNKCMKEMLSCRT